MNISPSDLKLSLMSQISKEQAGTESKTTYSKDNSSFSRLVKNFLDSKGDKILETDLALNKIISGENSSNGQAISLENILENLSGMEAFKGTGTTMSDAGQGSGNIKNNMDEPELMNLIQELINSLNEVQGQSDKTINVMPDGTERLPEKTKASTTQLYDVISKSFELIKEKADTANISESGNAIAENKSDIMSLIDKLNLITDTQKANEKLKDNTMDLNQLMLLLLLGLNSKMDINVSGNISREALTTANLIKELSFDKNNINKLMLMIPMLGLASKGEATELNFKGLMDNSRLAPKEQADTLKGEDNQKNLTDTLITLLNSLLDSKDIKEELANNAPGNSALKDTIKVVIAKLEGYSEPKEKSSEVLVAGSDKGSTNSVVEEKDLAQDISLKDALDLPEKRLVSYNVPMEMEGKLNSLFEKVIPQLEAGLKGEKLEGELRARFQQLIEGIDLTQLKGDADLVSVNGNSEASTRITQGIDAFKNKLVELLVVLSKDYLKDNDNGVKKPDTAKKFTGLFNELLSKDDTKKGTASQVIQNINKTSIPGVKTEASINSAKAQGNSKLSKENKILSGVIGNEEDKKVNKVNTFIAQLNNVKEDIQRAELPDKPIVNRASFTQDMVKTVKYMNLNGLKELTVKIAPRELGEITIKLSMEEGNLKANISAHSKETYNLLSSNMGDLKTSLGNNDIRIQNVDINIYQEDTTFFNENFNRGSGSGEEGSRGNNGSRTEEVSDLSEVNFKGSEQESNISALA